MTGFVALAPVVAAAAFAGARGDRRVVAYLAVWLLLAALVRAVHRRWPLPAPVLLALSVAGAVHLAGGLAPSPDRSAPTLYETWLVPGVLKYDQLAHAAICAVVTLAAAHVVDAVVDHRAVGPVARALAAVLVCWGFGAANELLEFLTSLRFDDSYAGDLSNAGWDLAFNAAGSTAAAWWLVSRARAPAT